MTTSHIRGHKIYFDGQWRYCDNGQLIIETDRPCIRCGRMPTPEGHDACLGKLNSVSHACCGHGIGNAYQINEILSDQSDKMKRMIQNGKNENK